MLRKASRAWGIAPARRSPENLPLAAFLHGDHPFGFESPVKPFLNEKNPQASQLTDFSGGKRGIWKSLLRKASRAWGIAPARRSPENLPLAAFLHGDHPFGFESPVKPFLNEKNPQASQLTDFSGGKRGIRTLGGFMAHTRFPVVRLRPAQPSFHVEVLTRFELVNEGFADLCLTTWPQHQIWSGLRGSNSLPPPWQGGALPDELKPQIVAQL